MNIAELKARLDASMGTAAKPAAATNASGLEPDPFDWSPDADRDDEEECKHLRKRITSLENINGNLRSTCDLLREQLERMKARHADQ
jgi:hypothetical protein